MKRLYRNLTNRKVSGVCSGIADYIDVDVTVIRLIALVLIIMSGVLPGLVGYAVAALIMPEKGLEK